MYRQPNKNACGSDLIGSLQRLRNRMNKTVTSLLMWPEGEALPDTIFKTRGGEIIRFHFHTVMETVTRLGVDVQKIILRTAE